MMTVRNFLKSISRLFSSQLTYRGVYAILSGELVGATVLYIREDDIGNSCAFLVLSPTEAVYIAKKDFLEDLKYDNICLIQRMPKEVYIQCRANFVYYAKKKGIYASR